MSAAYATLWYVEHVDNDGGRWAREWFATDGDAWVRYDALRAQYRTAHRTDEHLVGEYGDVATPAEQQVDLTPAGVLAFAQDWADNRGE